MRLTSDKSVPSTLPPTVTGGMADAVMGILELARWAPSGDNAQPWRFTRIGAELVRIDTRDQSQECLYERDGRCGLQSIGALLETVRLAATTVGRKALIAQLAGGNHLAPSFSVTFVPDPEVRPDPLAAWIRTRSVHRGSYASRALLAGERRQLQDAIGPAYVVRFAEGDGRWDWARLNQRASLLRLDTHEGWELMGRIVEWGATTSADRLPDQALGLPKWMLGLARSQLTSWPRTRFVNRWLAGTWGPRLLLDWLPGLRCAAHLAIQATRPDDTTDGWLRAGGAVQRLWLAATGLGLQHQPGLTPLVFARYARDGIPFTSDPRAVALATRVGDELRHLLGRDALERTVWLGRLGAAAPAAARSVRLPLSKLCVSMGMGE